MNITVVAKTRAKKASITKIDDTNYIVAVKEEPHNDKANDAIIKALSRHFHVTKSQIGIKLGKTGKKKIVTIDK
jgi:uncharacterized protein YggU (UPF0235/DUF167 family)